MQDSHRMRTKRPGIVILLFSLVLAIVATMAVLDLVRREVQLATEHALDYAQTLVMKTTGLQLKYDYLSLDSLNRFSMHGIELVRGGLNSQTAPEAGSASHPGSEITATQVPIKLQRLSVQLSFWAILTGHNDEALRDIVADNLRVSLRLPDDEAILNTILANFSSDSQGSLPHFMLTVGPVEVQLQERTSVVVSQIQSESLNAGTFTIDSLQFSSLSGAPEITAPSVSAKIDGLWGLPRNLSLKLGVQGSGTSDFSTLSATIDVSARTPDWLLVPQRFSIVERGGRVEVEKKGMLGVKGWYEKGAWGVEGEMEGYEPSSDVEVGGVLGEVLGGVRVGGVVSVRGGGKGVEGYEVEVGVEGKEGEKVGGYEVGGMKVRVKGDGDTERYRGSVVGEYKGYEVRYEGEVGYKGLAVVGEYGVEGGEVKGLKGVVRGGEGAYEVTVGGGEVKGVECGEGRGEVRRSGEGYEVRYEGEVGRGEVKVEGSIGGGYEGVVEVKGVDAGEVGKVFGIEGVAGKVGGRVYGLVKGGKVSWSVSGGEYAGEVNGTKAEVKVEGVGDEEGYEVKGAEVSIGGVKVGMKGKGKYRGEVFRGEVNAGGMGYEVTVEESGGKIGVKVGEKLVGEVKVGGGRVEGVVKFDSFGVGVSGGVVWVSGGVRGWYEKGSWGGELERVRVRYEGEGEYPEVEVSGTITPQNANLSVENIKYDGKELKGIITANYSSLITLMKNVQVDYSFSALENERAKIEGNIKAIDGKVAVSIHGAAIPLEQFVPSSLNITGDVQFQGSAAFSLSGAKLSWTDVSLAELKFDCQKTEIKGIPFSAAGTISLNNGIVSINSGSFSYQNYKIENVQAHYDMTKQEVDYSFNTKIVIAEKLCTAFMKGTSNINGSIFDKEAFNNAKISGQISELKFDSTNIDNIEYAFSVVDNNIALDLFQANGDSAHASIKNMNEFELTIHNLFKINGQAKGTMSDANDISADINLNTIDLGSLQMFISSKDFKDISGNGSGSVHISGDIADPKIDGQISLGDVSFSSNIYLFEKAGPFNAEITINDGVIELSPTIIRIGTGKVSVAATASLTRWNLGDIKAFISTEETASVKFKGTIGGLTSKGVDLKADIKAVISQSKFDISGNVLLDNGILEVNPGGFTGSGDAGQEVRPLAINLDLTLGKNIELYLPSQDLPLVKGMASPNSRMAILYDEASGALSVSGNVELRSGYVLYLLRNFFIKQCSIDFAENQTKFDPLISTTAELKEPSKDGMVTITLSADRLPFENFKPSLSSIPPKSEAELLALLGGGLALSDYSESTPLTLREAVIASSEFLTQNTLFRSFEQRIQKALGLDVLYIQSSFIQRWLLDITDQTSSGKVPLSEYLTGTQLFAGKYITDSAFAHLTVRMAQDPLEETGSLQLDSELGLELQAPFGLLQWGMSFGEEGTPLNNQTLSLSWRISY